MDSPEQKCAVTIRKTPDPFGSLLSHSRDAPAVCHRRRNETHTSPSNTSPDSRGASNPFPEKGQNISRLFILVEIVIVRPYYPQMTHRLRRGKGKSMPRGRNSQVMGSRPQTNSDPRTETWRMQPESRFYFWDFIERYRASVSDEGSMSSCSLSNFRQWLYVLTASALLPSF
jgi:hypothetical protein